MRSFCHTALLTALPAALLAVVTFAQPALLTLATNGDALLPADLVWEMLTQPDLWRSFQWPRIPSLFPDVMVFGSLQSLFGWRWAQLGYGALSLAAMTGLAGAIGRTLAPIGGRAAAVAFLAATAVVLLGEWGAASTAWHLHLLLAAYHSGPFILSVAALALAWRGGRSGLCAMVAAAWLGTFSDRMFVFTFLIPLAAALTGLAWRCALDWNDAARRILLAAAGCALGVVADSFVFSKLLTRQADAGLSLPVMLTRGIAFLETGAAWFALACVACVLVPLWRRSMPPGIRFWWLAAASAVVPTFFLAGALWEDEGGQRYLCAVLWWPVVLWAPRLAQFGGQRTITLGLAVVSGAIAAFGGTMVRTRSHPLLAWTSPVLACVAATGRGAGLADYWLARPMTVASDWRVRVAQIRPDGAARLWGNDPSWFTRTATDPLHPPPFSFIVMKKLDEAAIRASYGPADRVLACPGSDVWLYDTPGRLTAGLAAASPALVPRGRTVCAGPAALRRHGGALPEGPMRFSSDRSTSRPVAFGPEFDLYSGRWRVALTYRLQTDRPGADGWQVNGERGRLHFARMPLPATGAEWGESAIEVALNRAIEAVEVPVYLAGNATLEIRKACFTPLE